MCPSSWQIIFKENIIENIRMPKEENINFITRTFLGLSRCSNEQLIYLVLLYWVFFCG